MEIFRDIEGYDGLYQVSNLGNIKSYHKYKEGKILRPAIHWKGYGIVVLTGNIRKNCWVHRLVAKAFIPNPENKKEVNHINGIKNDNQLENLEWATSSENMKHAFRTGLAKERKGKDNVLSIPVIQLTLDGEFVANYAGAKEAARQIGAQQSGISKCCNGVMKKSFGYKWQYKI